MEVDEDIKQDFKEEKNYDELSVKDLSNEINMLKKHLKSLEKLLKNKKTGHNEANKLFKK